MNRSSNAYPQSPSRPRAFASREALIKETKIPPLNQSLWPILSVKMCTYPLATVPMYSTAASLLHCTISDGHRQGLFHYHLHPHGKCTVETWTGREASRGWAQVASDTLLCLEKMQATRPVQATSHRIRDHALLCFFSASSVLPQCFSSAPFKKRPCSLSRMKTANHRFEVRSVLYIIYVDIQWSK